MSDTPPANLKKGRGQYLRPVLDQIGLHAIAGSIVVVFGRVKLAFIGLAETNRGLALT